MNLTLGLISIILVFSSIIVIEKLFKKEGLYVYLCLATVLANIIVVKTVNVLGLVTSLGNILFAANFLITDILIEKYSKEDAKKSSKLRSNFYNNIYYSNANKYIIYTRYN